MKPFSRNAGVGEEEEDSTSQFVWDMGQQQSNLAASCQGKYLYITCTMSYVTLLPFKKGKNNVKYHKTPRTENHTNRLYWKNTLRYFHLLFGFFKYPVSVFRRAKVKKCIQALLLCFIVETGTLLEVLPYFRNKFKKKGVCYKLTPHRDLYRATPDHVKKDSNYRHANNR